MNKRNYENKKLKKNLPHSAFKTLPPQIISTPLASNPPPRQPSPQGINLQITADDLKKQKLFLAVPMYGGMCLFNDQLIRTEEGLKTIKWVVDTRYSGKVLSFNFEYNKFVWSRVTNWFSRRNGKYNDPSSKKNWISIGVGNTKHKLKITEEHRCAVFDNPLNPKIYYDEAKNIQGKYIVKIPDSVDTFDYPLLNHDQLSCILGSLLGDGTIGKSGNFRTTHSLKQRQYIEFFNDIVGGKLYEEKVSKGSYSKDDTQIKFRLINPQTKFLRGLVYPKGKKVIKDILHLINEKSLAFWYMDDGYIINPKNSSKAIKNGWNPSSSAILCTDGFSQEESVLLCDMLQSRWGIKASTIKNRKFYRIAISVEGSKIFWNLIAPYIHESMRYKFPADFVFGESYKFNSRRLDFSAALVQNVKKYITHTSKLYDIEVEGTHNFVANNYLVHNCAGVFSKSVMDLSALCTHYGLPLQAYFLFNESLITRARNYCVDEFMRSDATHLMFIDSDIGFNPNDVIALLGLTMQDPDMYHIIGGPYPKKSGYYGTLVHTEEGLQKLGVLVKNKYTGKVLTINEQTGRTEWNKVLTHSQFPGNGKKWVQIGRRGRKNLVVTHDHECLYLDNPLQSEIKRIEAENLTGKYILRNPVEAGKNSIRALYNEEQFAFLVGTLLGDGCITKGYLKFGHSDKQLEYLELKKKIFGGKIGQKRQTNTYQPQPKEVVMSDGSIQFMEQEERQYYGYFMDCPRNAQIEKLQELFYPEGKKTVKNILHMLDERGLAFWYMDDGTCRQQTGRKNSWTVNICSEGFSYDDHVLIKEYLFEKFDMDVTIANHKGKFRIRVPVLAQGKLFKLISQYVPVHMEYKLPPHYREGVKHKFNIQFLDYACELVQEVKVVDNTNPNSNHQPRTQYDIGVENNHNYIADNYFISNCISWEKIKLAVDKGFADKNPNDLEKFVGDYVFNPKGGQTEIPIGVPAEVLEIGTGFMMVPKNTFKVFEQKMPQYLYRPDHVRTAHFDGSRQIMQYFQAEIDNFDVGGLFAQSLEQIKNMNGEEEIKAFVDQTFHEAATKLKASSNRYLSEDYWFCQKIQQLGLRAWLCPWMQLAHMGSMIFGGSLADLARIGASATASVDELRKARETV